MKSKSESKIEIVHNQAEIGHRKGRRRRRRRILWLVVNGINFGNYYFPLFFSVFIHIALAAKAKEISLRKESKHKQKLKEYLNF